MKYDRLEDRVEELESSLGYVELPDGTKFRPTHSGIRLYRSILKTELDLGREPVLSDFTDEEQYEITCYAKWPTVAGKDGALRVMVSDLSREIVARS
jgi:hypothetical protein